MSDQTETETNLIWQFAVTVPACLVGPDDTVVLTGNHIQLGAWTTVNALKMVRSDTSSGVRDSDSGEVTRWTCQLSLPTSVRSVRYRYAVCQIFDPYTFGGREANGVEEPVVVVKWWETSLKPRRIRDHTFFSNPAHGVDQFGCITDRTSSEVKQVACPTHLPKLGRQREPRTGSAVEVAKPISLSATLLTPPTSQVQMQRGWLTSETCVELKFYGHQCIEIWRQSTRNQSRTRVGRAASPTSGNPLIATLTSGSLSDSSTSSSPPHQHHKPQPSFSSLPRPKIRGRIIDQRTRFAIKLTPIEINADEGGINSVITAPTTVNDDAASALPDAVHDDCSVDIGEQRTLIHHWPLITVSDLNCGISGSAVDGDAHRRSTVVAHQPQPQNGAVLRPNSFLSFQIRLLDINSVSLLVDIYMLSEDAAATTDGVAGASEHIGSCYVHPHLLKDTLGRSSVAILSAKFQPIGKIVFDHLIVYPMRVNATSTKNMGQSAPAPSIMNRNGSSVGGDRGSAKRRICSGAKGASVDNIDTSVDVVDSVGHSTASKTSGCFTFAQSFAKHWKNHWNGLDVGHRGSGNSFVSGQSCAHIRENSIASLRNALQHGADAVEFDVHVSKDLIPVIYHNYEILTKVERRRRGDPELVRVPLKNLTLEQLQQLEICSLEELSLGIKEFKKAKISRSKSDGSNFANDNVGPQPSAVNMLDGVAAPAPAASSDESGSGRMDVEDDDEEEHNAFPTLEQALVQVDEHGAFNIELKWDMELADGTWESQNHQTIELNLFVDTILDTVVRYSGTRRIFFSSFNPDLCTVLRLKQNKYPVLFLTQGVNTRYARYRDPRTWTIDNASRFVEAYDILGVNAMAEDIIRDPSQVALVKGRGQIIFCWTDNLNDDTTIKLLKQLGIDGIVYDRVDVNNTKVLKESIFKIDQRLEQRHDVDLDDEIGVSSTHCDGSATVAPAASSLTPDLSEEERSEKSCGRDTRGRGSQLPNTSTPFCCMVAAHSEEFDLACNALTPSSSSEDEDRVNNKETVAGPSEAQ